MLHAINYCSTPKKINRESLWKHRNTDENVLYDTIFVYRTRIPHQCTALITPGGSFYLPPCEDTFSDVSFDDVQVSQNRPLDALNTNLVSRDVSPVRSQLKKFMGKDKWTDKALLNTES